MRYPHLRQMEQNQALESMISQVRRCPECRGECEVQVLASPYPHLLVECACGYGVELALDDPTEEARVRY